MQVAVREAKAKLSKFGDMAHDGEVVVVCKKGEPWFDMVPHVRVKRKTTPLAGLRPTVSEAESIAQLEPGDLPGWS